MGGLYYKASEQFVLKVYVLEAAKMRKRKNLSKFDKGPNLVADLVCQSISKIASLVGSFWSTVVSIYQNWSKEGRVESQ